MSRTIVVVAALLTSPVLAEDRSTTGSLRSAVAGTWSVLFQSFGTPDCSGVIHLSGTDAALTGGVVCHRPENTGLVYSASIAGELYGDQLRLNLTAQTNAFLLIDATVAPDRQSATGAGVGAGPYSGFTDYRTYSVTLTAK